MRISEHYCQDSSVFGDDYAMKDLSNLPRTQMPRSSVDERPLEKNNEMFPGRTVSSPFTMACIGNLLSKTVKKDDGPWPCLSRLLSEVTWSGVSFSPRFSGR